MRADHIVVYVSVYSALFVFLHELSVTLQFTTVASKLSTKGERLPGVAFCCHLIGQISDGEMMVRCL